MIAKMMSEAAHSIIGMFSAKPVGMENNASPLDFGSLLQSSQEQRSSESENIAVNASELVDGEHEDIDEGTVQNCSGHIMLPPVNQDMPLAAWPKVSVSGSLEVEPSIDDSRVGISPLSNPESKGLVGLTSEAKPLERGAPVLAAPTDSLELPQNLVDETKTSAPLVTRSGPEEMKLPDSRDLPIAPLSANAKDGRAPVPVGSPLVGVAFKLADSSGEAGKVEPLYPLAERSGRVETKTPVSRDLSIASLSAAYGSVPAPRTARSGGEGAKAADANVLSIASLFADAKDAQEPVPAGLPLDVRAAKRASADKESAIVEPLKARTAESVVNQLPLTSVPAMPTVREPVQASAPFDLLGPRVAERLAAEITNMSANGETKKFEINPRNLGRMEIMFTTRGATEIIEIQTDHRSAKDVIVQHSHILQDILKSQGRDDLTFRVDVKDNMQGSPRSENGNLAHQDNRDGREQQSVPRRPGRTASELDSGSESQPVSDHSRYA